MPAAFPRVPQAAPLVPLRRPENDPLQAPYSHAKPVLTLKPHRHRLPHRMLAAMRFRAGTAPLHESRGMRLRRQAAAQSEVHGAQAQTLGPAQPCLQEKHRRGCGETAWQPTHQAALRPADMPGLAPPVTSCNPSLGNGGLPHAERRPGTAAKATAASTRPAAIAAPACHEPGYGDARQLLLQVRGHGV